MADWLPWVTGALGGIGGTLAGPMGTALGTAGGYGLGSLLSGLWGDEEDEEGIKKTTTLSPAQQKLMDQLSSFYGSRIGKGLPAWGGEFAIPPTPGEEWGMGKYKEAVEGMDPTQIHDWYMQYIAPQEKRYMRQEIVPQIREAGVRAGTLRGTPTELRESKAWEQFGAGQLGRIGEAITTERAAGRAALPGYMTAAALPRLIEQLELTSRIEEFKRTTPELNPILNLAQQLLGTQTMAAYYQPGQTSEVMQLLQALAPGVGYGMGQTIGKS